MDARSKGIDSRFSEDVKIVNKDLNKITFDNLKKKQDFLDGQNSIRYNIYRTVLFFEIYFNNNYGYFLSSEEGINMSKTVVRKNESLDDALRRFKRSVSKAGTLQESRKREFYEKPSVRRKKKSEAARKRKKF